MFRNINNYLVILGLFAFTNVQSQLIPHTPIESRCQNGSQMDSLCIITDKQQFKNYRDKCSRTDFLDIDFENNFVIGYSSSGTSQYYIDTVNVLLKDSVYEIEVSICQSGNFTMLSIVHYWMTVPKLTDVINVQLKEIIKNCNNYKLKK
jgi:hypothetical protein